MNVCSSVHGSGVTALRGTTTRNPVVGLGVVGMNTVTPPGTTSRTGEGALAVTNPSPNSPIARRAPR